MSLQERFQTVVVVDSIVQTLKYSVLLVNEFVRY